MTPVTTKQTAEILGKIAAVLGDDMTPITAKQAAEILGKSQDSVTIYARNGRLQGEKIGGMWVFDRAVVEEFAKNKPTRGGARRRPKRKTAPPSPPIVGNWASNGRPKGGGRRRINAFRELDIPPLASNICQACGERPARFARHDKMAVCWRCFCKIPVR